jgi:hypothetical protein
MAVGYLLFLKEQIKGIIIIIILAQKPPAFEPTRASTVHRPRTFLTALASANQGIANSAGMILLFSLCLEIRTMYQAQYTLYVYIHHVYILGIPSI